MRSSLLVILSILLVSNTVHAGEHDLEIGRFMKYCLVGEESFTKERIGLSNNYIISVGQFLGDIETTYAVTDSFMVEVGKQNSSSINILNQTEFIEGALTDKYTLINVTFDSLYPGSAETGEILALALEFNDSREPEETKCKIWTGTQNMPCYDRDSSGSFSAFGGR